MSPPPRDGNVPVECKTIDDVNANLAGLMARLDAAGELMIDPPEDPAERERQIARVRAAFPYVDREPDWLTFLSAYGGLTYVRETQPWFSTGFFGVSYRASDHIIDGEGEPVSDGCLLICDADPPIIGGYLAFGFDATGERPWGVYGVTESGSEWYAPSFLHWLTEFVTAAV
jgi:hypothetical protein